MSKSKTQKRPKRQRHSIGSPGHRFNWIMCELEKRWPDPQPFSAMAGETRYFDMIDKERNSVRTALQIAITALDDWTCTVAPEFCDPQRVAEALSRLMEGGTLSYIANTLEQCRKALKEDNGDH
jgi:hypothetical protein